MRSKIRKGQFSEMLLEIAKIKKEVDKSQVMADLDKVLLHEKG